MRYKKGYKYQLVEDLYCYTGILNEACSLGKFLSLDNTGLLRLASGYAHDGASGPTFDTDSSMEASAVHDGLSQLIRNGKLSIKYKDTIDKLLKNIAISKGMWKWRANMWYKTLSFVNAYVTKPKKVYYIE